MILVVDLQPDEVTVGLLGSRSRQPVTVTAYGSLERHRLDSALVAVGAGCVPGHHAELRVAWLEQALGAEVGGHWPAERLDASGEWLSAALSWVDACRPRSRAGTDPDPTALYRSTWTEMERQGALLLQVTVVQPKETFAMLRWFQSG